MLLRVQDRKNRRFCQHVDNDWHWFWDILVEGQEKKRLGVGVKMMGGEEWMIEEMKGCSFSLKFQL